MTNGTITFDRLASIDRLKSGGIDDIEARAHAEALDTALRDNIATKSDIEELGRAMRLDLQGAETKIRDVEIRLSAKIQDFETSLSAKIQDFETSLSAKIRDFETSLSAKIQDFETSLSAKIQDFETRLEAKIQTLEARLEAKIETAIASVKVDVLRWLVVTQVALGGFIFAVLKVLH